MKSAETCSCSLCNKLYTYLSLHLVVLDKYIHSNLVYNTLQMQPHVIFSMGLRQGSGLCSSSSRKCPGTEGTNQNRH